MEENMVQSFEEPVIEPVPNDIVTKITATKTLLVAKVLSVISAIAWAPVLVGASILFLAIAGVILTNLGDVNIEAIPVILFFVLFVARIFLEMAISAIALHRVSKSANFGLYERKASLRFSYRIATAVAVLQWLMLALIVLMLLQLCYDRLNDRDGFEIGLAAIIILLCFVHTVALQMTAMGAKRFFDGTANKQSCTNSAIGLILAGLFELGNLIFVIAWMIDIDHLDTVFLEGAFIPLFIVTAFMAHGVYLTVLGILMIKKCRRQNAFELN